MSGITSFFSSFFSDNNTVHADSDKEDAEVEVVEEVEEEEPEDQQPIIREECKTERCAALAKHFEHCQEKVQAGKGFKGEDCVEELPVRLVFPNGLRYTDKRISMMHCIDDCAAPKLFAKLV